MRCYNNMILEKAIKNYLENSFISKDIDTYKHELSHANILIKFYGNIKISEINSNTILKYIILNKNKLSNRTINIRTQLLKRILKFNNVNIEKINFLKLKEPIKTYGFIDEINIKKTIDFIKKESIRNQCIFYLFLDTGIRLKELSNLKWNNIHIDSRFIKLENTKNKKERYVFFTKKTMLLLKKLNSKNQNEYVFVNQRTQKKLTKHSIENIFTKYKKKTNIKNFTPHRLRHTLTTNLYNNGANLIFISNILGHSSSEITKRYIHADIKNNLKLYDKFNIEK